MKDNFIPPGEHWRNKVEFEAARIRKEVRIKSWKFSGKFFSLALAVSAFNGVVYLMVKDNNNLPLSPFMLAFMLVIFNISVIITGMLKKKSKKDKKSDTDRVLGGFAAAGWVILGYTLLVSAALFPIFLFFGTFATVPLATIGGMLAGQSGYNSVWNSYSGLVVCIGCFIVGIFCFNRLFFVGMRGYMTRSLKK